MKSIPESSILLCILSLIFNQCRSFSIHPVPISIPLANSRRSFHASEIYSAPEDGDNVNNDENAPEGLDPSQMEWLQSRSESVQQSQSYTQTNENASEEEEIAAEKLTGNVNIPKTGVSINDEMTDLEAKENFVSQLFPLEIPGVAAIQTVTVDTTSDEPMRYIVPLTEVRGLVAEENESDANGIDDNDNKKDSFCEYAMIDVPPYSDELLSQIKSFMARMGGGKLSYILSTCRNGIHYDEAPSVYVTRKNDVKAWKDACDNVEIIMYRLDTPRENKISVTQSLDGYGPWALQSGQFNETGRPLTIMEWDDETQAGVLDNGETPPDDDENISSNDDELYTPEAIKKREQDKDILAIYTPGHTYGSLTYIFPRTKVCCSGFTIPVEDTRASASAVGLPMGAGPKLDFSGYLTTNSGGVDRQIESARHIAALYSDRFEVVLPSRGPPVNLGKYSIADRSQILHDIINEFAELGAIYNQMGII